MDLGDHGNDEHRRRHLGEEAHRLLVARQFTDALAIYDALIAYVDQPHPDYVNALWAVQADNTGLAIDPARARRYLAACLPHGGGAVHLNAAGVHAELGEHELALQHLCVSAAAGMDLAPHLAAPLFAPIAGEARFAALVAGERPAATPARVLALAVDAVQRGALDDAVPAIRI